MKVTGDKAAFDYDFGYQIPQQRSVINYRQPLLL